MLDINFIRNNQKKVADSAREKGYDVDVNHVIKLDDQRKTLLQTVEEKRRRRNEIASQMKGGKPSEKLIKEGNNLKLENSNLNLTNILQNYEYISDNVLDLSSFIEDYKNNSNSKWEEKNDKILMKTSNRTLYINRENGLPEKMEILDNGKKTAIYILYNEVNVNS